MTAGGNASNTGLMDITNGNFSTMPSGADYGVLALLSHTDYSQTCMLPRPTWPEVADSWMISVNNKGYALLRINPTTCVCSIVTAKETTIAGLGQTPPARSSQCTSITGDTNQYFVYADVTGGKANITVFENPFKDADMS